MKKICLILINSLLCLYIAACGAVTEQVPETVSETVTETVSEERVAETAQVTQAEEDFVNQQEEVTEEPVEDIPQPSEAELLEIQIDEILSKMTTKEKVAQLFMVTPESLTGYQTVTQAKEATAAAYKERPVAGIILFAKNVVNPDQLTEMNEDLHKIAMDRLGVPLWIAVDEEGGNVARVAGNPAFSAEEFPPAYKMAEDGGAESVYAQAATIGGYLSQYGFDLDFAPVADVWVNPENTVIGTRSYSQDPTVVSEMVMEFLRGLHDNDMLGCLKHFPGHGATLADSHKGSVQVNATLEEMRACELIPFEKGIESGVKIIMVGHIETPNIAESEGGPASLSRYMVTQLLRENMGYEGVVITDAMNMGAIAQQYDSGQAAVAAIEAGVDMILMPADFEMAYQGICAAVQEGRIDEARIDESVRRILRVKLG